MWPAWYRSGKKTSVIKIVLKQNTLGLMTKLALESTFMMKGLFALDWAGDELPPSSVFFCPLILLVAPFHVSDGRCNLKRV